MFLREWAGVNGYIVAKRHREGRKAMRAFLPEARGVGYRLPDSPRDGLTFRETKLSVKGNVVQFMLVPDRKRPNGREYNPYSVEAVLEGCRIRTLTVIERVTWLWAGSRVLLLDTDSTTGNDEEAAFRRCRLRIGRSIWIRATTRWGFSEPLWRASIQPP